VTGPWKDPKVEVIERSRDKPRRAAPAGHSPPPVTDLPRSR
jgi:hypothetical protein